MPTKQSEQLIQKIKSWNTNMEYFKKLIDRDDQNQKPKLEKTMDNINELSMEIKKLFEVSKNWPRDDRARAIRYQKDFLSKLNVYMDLLGDYRERKTTELSQFRNTYSERRQTIQHNPKNKKKQQQQQQSQKQVQIELQDVNQQTLFQQHMLMLKQKQLLQVKGKMDDALKVQKEVAKLVNEQGDKIDQIQENVDTARSNVKQAGTLLEEGVQHHQSATRKKMCIMGIIFLAILIIVIPILIKFL